MHALSDAAADVAHRHVGVVHCTQSRCGAHDAVGQRVDIPFDDAAIGAGADGLRPVQPHRLCQSPRPRRGGLRPFFWLKQGHGDRYGAFHGLLGGGGRGERLRGRRQLCQKRRDVLPRFTDGADRLHHRDLVALLAEQAQHHAGDLGGLLKGRLVRFIGKKQVPRGNWVSNLLVPFGQDAGLHRIPLLGHFDDGCQRAHLHALLSIIIA